MNKRILDIEVQEYIHHHMNADVHKIALSKSPFKDVTVTELAGQIAARKKCQRKLPLWYAQQNIYYPPLLSIEQCSSEITAQYKQRLALKGKLIDLTGGFGVDGYYFSQVAESVFHCEINPELSSIAAHNLKLLGASNTKFVAGDGLEFLANTPDSFDTIYLDPARRTAKGRAFMLEDCTPNVILHLDFLLSKAKRVIIKTAPLLDLSVGLKSLKNIAEIHVVSVKNECKELLWIIDRNPISPVKIVAVTLNSVEKQFSFARGEDNASATFSKRLQTYLYEPDAALLKSGAFDLIALRYRIEKLHPQTQLYSSNKLITAFPGRIFEINEVLSGPLLKKEKYLSGNVIVRNYRDTPESLIKKHKIKADEDSFLIFTQSIAEGYMLIKAKIKQYY